MNTENKPFDNKDSEIELMGDFSSRALTYDDLVEMNSQISDAMRYLTICSKKTKKILEPVIQMACDNFCDLCELMQVDPVSSDFDSYEENIDSLLNVLHVEEVWNRAKGKLVKALTKDGDKKTPKENRETRMINRFELDRIVGRSIYVFANTHDKDLIVLLNEKYKSLFENVIAELTKCKTDVFFL